MKTTNVWDVIVIGGGPAGMMAAATAASRGKRVLLLEKNPSLGKKLLITGGGRCNVTNDKPDIRAMQAQYKGAGKFLFSLFAQHGVRETIEWFESRGIALKEENEGRLFPATNSAKTIFDTLLTEVKKQGVTVRTKAEVCTIIYDSAEAKFDIVLSDKTRLEGKSCVVASGGTSRPETGATGDGYLWLKKLGHAIVPNNFALVPLTLKNTWTKKLSGITLTNIKLTIFTDGKKHSVHEGKILFTHVGVTGPTVLNMSKAVGELLAHSEVTLKLDLFPKMDAGEFKTFLRQKLAANSNKKIKNVLGDIIPTALASSVLSELCIIDDTQCHSVTTEERVRLALFLKAVPLSVKGLLGEDKAVVSSGGVPLTEISFKTMESKIVPNLYIIGDLLNIDRPSGGYSLQLCWSTGFVAGSNA
ncbi:MAG: NAD(P)/FAD-dependent oxidoreductase [Patescibacteria group bacterium]